MKGVKFFHDIKSFSSFGDDDISIEGEVEFVFLYGAKVFEGGHPFNDETSIVK